MLEEGVYIKTKPTVLDSDKIWILRKRLEANEIGEIVFNLETIRVLLTNNTNDEIIDNVLNSELDEETMAQITGWFDKLSEALSQVEEAKKKPDNWWETIKSESDPMK